MQLIEIDTSRYCSRRYAKYFKCSTNENTTLAFDSLLASALVRRLISTRKLSIGREPEMDQITSNPASRSFDIRAAAAGGGGYRWNG
jgi:hypothetical protein